MSKKFSLDTIIAIILVLVGAFWLKLCADLPDDALVSQFTKPQTIPSILAVLIIILSVALIAKNLWTASRNTENADPAPKTDKMDMLRVAAMIVLALLYVSVVKIIGYLPCTIIFLGATLWLFGVRNKVVILVVMITVPSALYLLFQMLLKVQLP